MQEILISLFTLTVLEIVLGIDNIIFITILAGRAAKAKQDKARNYGMIMGMGVRILLLLGLNWIQKQDTALFTVLHHDISGKDILLILGGLFLLYQSVHEIHEKIKGDSIEEQTKGGDKSWTGILLQMLLINIVFSLDSVITAVGMADHLWVMITAVVLSMIVMLWASKPIANFVEGNPSIKILALSFLVLIGVSLLAEGFEQELNKGYIYFSMAFAFTIEIINIRIDKRGKKSKKDL